MVNKLLQILSLRCRHKKLSKPFAGAASSGRGDAEWDGPVPPMSHYVVCLDCGHEMEYDWAQMRVVGK